jgi:hypothetical protein
MTWSNNITDYRLPLGRYLHGLQGTVDILASILPPHGGMALLTNLKTTLFSTERMSRIKYIRINTLISHDLSYTEQYRDTK